MPEPAYEGARVLSVRHGDLRASQEASEQKAETPNLDLVRDWLLEERYQELSRQIG